MERIPDKKTVFERSDKPANNPFIGFTSYQMFRDDPLFDDLIVDPAKKMIETEATECYPVGDEIGRGGNGQGFYPATAVAYIRLPWKDVEPKRGEYDFTVIENILARAKEKEQTVMLRLMPHSTRARDDVPAWLKKLMPCPERPDGMRVKDSPADPAYLRLFGEAVAELARRFDGDPTLDVMDISITGAWGEGHRVGDYPRTALEELMDVYTSSFKNTRLIGQVAAPWLITYACGSTPCGWRGDGVGEPHHMTVKYPNAVDTLGELWKKAPVSFESFWWLGEWERKGWDIDEMIEKTLAWNASTFNAKSFPIPEKWRDKVERWVGKMGYHFLPHTFEYPSRARAGETLMFSLEAENVGVAPIYNAVPLRLRLKSGGREFVFDTGVDVRKWLPGPVSETFCVKLPEDALPGEYIVGLSISNEEGLLVRWEAKGESDGAFLNVGSLRITE